MSLPTVTFSSKEKIINTLASYPPLQKYGEITSIKIAEIVARSFILGGPSNYMGYSRNLNCVMRNIKATLHPPEDQISRLKMDIHEALKGCCQDPYGVMNMRPLSEEELPPCVIS